MPLQQDEIIFLMVNILFINKEKNDFLF